MRSTPEPITPQSKKYSQQIHRPLHCLLFVLPFLVVFQVGAAFCGSSLLAPRDLNRLLHYFGAKTAYFPAMAVVILVLLAQHLFRRDRWEVRPNVLAGMLAESMVWAIPLMAVNHVCGMLPAAKQTVEATNIWSELFSNVGAGVYEEFLFRLLFINLVVLVFVDVMELRKDAVAIAAIVVSAVLFSLYHFSAAQLAGALAFPWRLFVFYAVAGVYLGWMFLWRGFGIAAGIHIAHNVYVLAWRP